MPGCTVHLGQGAFSRSATAISVLPPNHSPDRTDRLGGTAIGAGCLTPGPWAIAEYGGYLRLAGTRDGAQKPFTVIL